MLAEINSSTNRPAVNDLTQQYLVVLQQDTECDVIQRQLAVLTQQRINARSVQWISLPAEGNNEEKNEAISLDEELLACLNLAREKQAAAIQASQRVPKAFDIAIHVPKHGTLVSRIIANERTLPSFVALLQLAAGYFVMAEKRQSQLPAPEVQTSSRLLSAVSKGTSLAEVGRTWSLDLSTVAGAKIALLCLKKGWRNKLELVAMSSRDIPAGQGEVTQTACQMARQAMIASGEADGIVGNHGHCHAQSADRLALQLGVHQAVAYALVDAHGEAQGAVILAGDTLLPKKLEEAQRLIAATSPVLLLNQKALPAKQRNKTSSTVKRTAWIAGAVLLLAGLMALPIPYYLRCETTLEPVTRRFIGAPFTGVLSQAHAESGDLIEAGQLLANLDDQPLKIKRSQIAVELARVTKQREVHLAQGEIAKSQIDELRRKELNAELQLIDQQLNQAEIRSPISGVVLSNDLNDVVDAPVDLGQNLFEIAPLDSLRARILVPDEDADSIEVGRVVHVWILGNSGPALEGELSRISPIAEVQEGKNAITAEVILSDPEKLLRPGMKGRASIDVGKKTVGWIVFHRLWNQWRIYSPW
ncbi:efflux RND transporter periplasmic adaptor subunit [Bremerella sp. T1]|uniref:efflux RND transporter periplasmic adaptor subunit n=1 Tax=Bremerella sp. TYQ1 TaxID=3119568 RepID=UPI001CCAB0AB|nr:HlyD family efflux transporter periplasmic adaptor subunit [Bremerella volcania]UBM36283.1 HlyD family efflux transporter periplasmic adaptor subunit [Bremerella volcania]